MPCELQKKMLSVCQVPNHPGKHEDIFESALQFFFGRLGKEWCCFCVRQVSTVQTWFGLVKDWRGVLTLTFFTSGEWWWFLMVLVCCSSSGKVKEERCTQQKVFLVEKMISMTESSSGVVEIQFKDGKNPVQFAYSEVQAMFSTYIQWFKKWLDAVLLWSGLNTVWFLELKVESAETILPGKWTNGSPANPNWKGTSSELEPNLNF